MIHNTLIKFTFFAHSQEEYIIHKYKCLQFQMYISDLLNLLLWQDPNIWKVQNNAIY